VRLPYTFFVGFRYLKAKKRERAVSLNTGISVAGVALGVAALIIVLSVMTGFQDHLRDRILGVNAHVVIFEYGPSGVEAPDKVVRLAREVPGVVAAAPYILSQVLFTRGPQISGGVVRGIDPGQETGVSDLPRNLKEGRLEDLGPAERGVLPGILVGKELALRLGLLLGDRVVLVSPQTRLGPFGTMVPRMKSFRVVGIFESGMYEYDAALAYIHLSEAQKFFDMPGRVTGVGVRVADIYQAREVAQRLQERLGPIYYTRDWMQMNRNLFSALKLEKLVMFIILVLIVLVAAFNIVGTLTMLVMEKQREIAILKAMGAPRRDIMRIFMVNGLLIGGVGTLVGVLVGYGVCVMLQKYQFITLPSDIYYLSHLPVHMRWQEFLAVSVAAVTISFLATLYPSWKAATLDPVEALRYE